MKRLFPASMFFLSAVLLSIVIGCSAAQVKETGGNLLEAGGEAIDKLLKDPSLLFTPAGAITGLGLLAVGFFSRESASIARWSGKKTLSAAKRLKSKKEGV